MTSFALRWAMDYVRRSEAGRRAIWEVVAPGSVAYPKEDK